MPTSTLVAAALLLGASALAGAAPPAGCRPQPLLPSEGAELDNGQLDRNDVLLWEFSWKPCRSAEAYHLNVMGPQAVNPVIDRSDLKEPSYRHEKPGSFVVDENLGPWTWRVRARVDGAWGAWSEPRTFMVAPPGRKGSPAPIEKPLPPAPVLPTGARCPVVLEAPGAGALLDNGVRYSKDPIHWEFSWRACPEATSYHLIVTGPHARFALLDGEVPAASHVHEARGFIAERNLGPWHWKVRARVGDQWGDWSEEREFRVRPPTLESASEAQSR